MTTTPVRLSARRVLRVIDGNTILASNDNPGGHRYRLHGIDAPTGDQPYAVEAASELERLIEEGTTGGVVYLQRHGRDRKARIDLVTVYTEKVPAHALNNLNYCMIVKGHAWSYAFHCVASSEGSSGGSGSGLEEEGEPSIPAGGLGAYDSAQSEAQKQGYGLWRIAVGGTLDYMPQRPAYYREQQQMRINFDKFRHHHSMPELTAMATVRAGEGKDVASTKWNEKKVKKEMKKYSKRTRLTGVGEEDTTT